jgi:hypothetical protein
MTRGSQMERGAKRGKLLVIALNRFFCTFCTRPITHFPVRDAYVQILGCRPTHTHAVVAKSRFHAVRTSFIMKFEMSKQIDIPAGVKADSFKKGRRAESVPPFSYYLCYMSSNFEHLYI